jgi:hypothetical protein
VGVIESDFNSNYDLPQEGLVAHWPLDEEQGVVVYDQTEFGHHGELTSDASWRPSQGQFSGAIELEGEQHVSVPPAQTLFFSEQLSIAAWIRLESSGRAGQAVVSRGQDAWSLLVDGESGRARFVCCGQDRLESTSTLADGRWHHLVGVVNGTWLLLYVDGQVEATAVQTQALQDSMQEIRLGADPQGAATALSGWMDDVLLYNRALSSGEVEAAMVAGINSVPDQSAPDLEVERYKLRGRLGDLSGQTRLFINGNEITVQADGSWEFEVQASEMLQGLTLEARTSPDIVTTTIVRANRQ